MISVPYKAIITSTVTFTDFSQQLIDPATVELRLGGVVYTFASGAVTRVSQGVYRRVWQADTPGRFKRVWVGEGPSVYAQSDEDDIQVRAPLPAA